MSVPKITGLDVLRAVRAASRGLPTGSPFTISLLDSYDLFELESDQLTTPEFGISAEAAQRIVAGLRKRALTELSGVLGVRLIVDNDRAESLIPNAPIIRSAGAWADEPQSLEDMLSFFDQLRHGTGN